MIDIKKIKRAASVAFVVVSAALLFTLAFMGNSIRLLVMWNDMQWSLLTVITMPISFLMITSSLIISLTLLYAIKNEETPFNFKNVKRLKALAVILILFEPSVWLADFIYLRHNPPECCGGWQIIHGGIILAAGLIIYCVALVFQYGIALQTQADETL